jgi:hypothetical protein
MQIFDVNCSKELPTQLTRFRLTAKYVLYYSELHTTVHLHEIQSLFFLKKLKIRCISDENYEFCNQ